MTRTGKFGAMECVRLDAALPVRGTHYGVSSSTWRGDYLQLPAKAGTFLFHINTLQSHWSATLRYSPVDANQNEINEVYSSVEWIKQNYIDLWSSSNAGKKNRTQLPDQTSGTRR